MGKNQNQQMLIPVPKQGSFKESYADTVVSKDSVPLAERMRPRTLDEILGQEEVIGPNAPLGKILRDKTMAVPSMILFGGPGIGKTTLARVIADSSNYRFVRLSGVLDGVSELKTAVRDAESALRHDGRPTLALVDEIHRFNKAQQDAFLPHIESGLLTVIGQTTENVSFRIRNTLLSRMRVVELKPISIEALEEIIDRALIDKERGLGNFGLIIEREARGLIAKLAMGDARRALTNLEWTVAHVVGTSKKEIKLADVHIAVGKPPPSFDQDGDYHYDCISAFIKSMRGSDPDAALYYMIRALEGGEDPLFITRRMIIFASEDASCDPRALEIALNVDKAVERVGMPEGRIPLAQGVVYLSCCQKSNRTYVALREMERIVEEYPDLEIPKRLRNAPTELMKQFGNSIGYRYPHDEPGAFVPERYLPDIIADLEVYQPSDRGIDLQIRERLDQFRKLIRAKKHQ